MMKLDGVVAFVPIAEAGSISEAARRLSLSKSVMSERLAELERSLGARLVQRTTRKMSLTEDGPAFLERGRRIAARGRPRPRPRSPNGAAPLSDPSGFPAPVSFGILHLGPALYPICSPRNPGHRALARSGRSLRRCRSGRRPRRVIRHGPIRDDRLIDKQLASSRRLLVASPVYLMASGVPRSAAELEERRAILYANRSTDWRFDGAGGTIVVRPKAALRVNNGIGDARCGAGRARLALLPTFLVHQELLSGALLSVDIGLEAEGAELFLAYPKDRSASAKILGLTRALRHAIGDPPYWETGL